MIQDLISRLKGTVFLPHLKSILFAIVNRFKIVAFTIIKTDMVLYEFSKRFSIYPFFIFALFFGKKGCTALLHPLLFLLRIVCFYLSWYLAMTSIVLFVLFNFPYTKKVLYAHFDPGFIAKTVGNPAGEGLYYYVIPLAAALGYDTYGKHVATVDKINTAQIYHETAKREIAANPYLTKEQKAEMSKVALLKYGELMKVPVQGPFSSFATQGLLTVSKRK